MELATITPNFTFKLPKEIMERFKQTDRFIVAGDGDTVILKRVLPSLTNIVGNAEAGKPLSLNEINDIVHKVRKQRRNN